MGMTDLSSTNGVVSVSAQGDDVGSWDVHTEVELGVGSAKGADGVSETGLVGSKCGAICLGLDLVVTLCSDQTSTTGQELLQEAVVPVPPVGSIWSVAAHSPRLNGSMTEQMSVYTHTSLHIVPVVARLMACCGRIWREACNQNHK